MANLSRSAGVLPAPKAWTRHKELAGTIGETGFTHTTMIPVQLSSQLAINENANTCSICHHSREWPVPLLELRRSTGPMDIGRDAEVMSYLWLVAAKHLMTTHVSKDRCWLNMVTPGWSSWVVPCVAAVEHTVRPFRPVPAVPAIVFSGGQKRMVTLNSITEQPGRSHGRFFCPAASQQSTLAQGAGENKEARRCSLFMGTTRKDAGTYRHASWRRSQRSSCQGDHKKEALLTRGELKLLQPTNGVGYLDIPRKVMMTQVNCFYAHVDHDNEVRVRLTSQTVEAKATNIPYVPLPTRPHTHGARWTATNRVLNLRQLQTHFVMASSHDFFGYLDLPKVD
ncbi:hypothetical protein HPP92_028864 [Vanilla planifolia]|uniref:fructose-bisphosphate aldolase n=1 Tax=Vanilla planifolia TaxID=51239 RepID=A0A835P4B6_VANPL|nr:hypothetical protein HPP92_028864 [Vanilla planifolia]KAG0446397.1 hypothetical protein HPP92_028853 [Vanilla planifolia]